MTWTNDVICDVCHKRYKDQYNKTSAAGLAVWGKSGGGPAQTLQMSLLMGIHLCHGCWKAVLDVLKHRVVAAFPPA